MRGFEEEGTYTVLRATVSVGAGGLTAIEIDTTGRGSDLARKRIFGFSAGE